MYKTKLIAILAMVFIVAACNDHNPGQEPDVRTDRTDRTDLTDRPDGTDRTDRTAATPSFEELDRDRTGFISRTDAAALPCLRDNFDDIDTRNEEGLDRSEFQQAVARYC